MVRDLGTCGRREVKEKQIGLGLMTGVVVTSTGWGNMWREQVTGVREGPERRRVMAVDTGRHEQRVGGNGENGDWTGGSERAQGQWEESRLG